MTAIADSYYWRYLKGGRVTHALRESDDDGALCGALMKSSLGTGTQAEYERAATLRRCPDCLAELERIAARYAELRERADRERRQ